MIVRAIIAPAQRAGGKYALVTHRQNSVRQHGSCPGAARLGQTALYPIGPGFNSQPLHLPLSPFGRAEQYLARPS